MSTNFISPTGSVELDNDCTYSIDKLNVRSRETVITSEDLAFYFKEYLEPKYGLGNINVNNVASFMKDLEMNWTKLSPDMKNKVMDIMVDGILNKESYFKNALLQKLNISLPSTPVPNTIPSGFTNVFSKSSFGNVSNNKTLIIVAVVVIAIALFFFFKKKGNVL